MPHLVVKNFNLCNLNFPLRTYGYEFSFVAVSKKDALVLVKKFSNQFFLQILQRDKNKAVIKIDKLTKIPNNAMLKDTLKRFAKITNLEVVDSNVNLDKGEIVTKEYSCFIDIGVSLDIIANSQKNNLEIGFGSSRFLLHQALKHTNELFFGLEIHDASIERALKAIKRLNISNLYIIKYDARSFLKALPSNSLDTIFLHFPMPWSSNMRRRVISPLFLNEAQRVLKKSGFLDLKTDDEGYFKYSLECSSKIEDLCIKKSKNIPSEISSKYEDRWIRMNKDIYNIRFISLKNNPNPKINKGNLFFFKEKVFFDKIKGKFSKEILRGNQFYIHFENVYEIDKSSGLVKFSFITKFNTQHRYIYIDNQGDASYIPSYMIICNETIQLHKNILEWLTD